jgi:hypothetical protein
MFEKYENQNVLYPQDIVENPAIVDKIVGRYQLVSTSPGMIKGIMDVMNRVLNIMADKGWRPISTAGTAVGYYVLFERIDQSDPSL